MRRSLFGRHLSDEYLASCRFKLGTVLTRLTAGQSHDGFHDGLHAVRRIAESPVCDSTAEFARYCKWNLAANRADWKGFLTRQVSEALERIDNGSYGLCLQCGEPIEVNRLAALPWVACCTACQERKAERRAM